MRRFEYGAGYGDNSEYERVQVQLDSIGSIEHARAKLAEIIRIYGKEDWLINPRLVKREGPKYLWQDVQDPARELMIDTLIELAGAFGSIGEGIVQGSDVHDILVRALRKISNVPDPMEFTE